MTMMDLYRSVFHLAFLQFVLQVAGKWTPFFETVTNIMNYAEANKHFEHIFSSISECNYLLCEYIELCITYANQRYMAE